MARRRAAARRRTRRRSPAAGAARRRHGLPGVALVADPGVAVVVVAPLVRPLGQRHRRGGDHGTGGAGHAAQHGEGLAHVLVGQRPVHRGNGPPPGVLGRRPGPVGVRGVPAAGSSRRSPGPGRGGRRRARRGSAPAASHRAPRRPGPRSSAGAAIPVRAVHAAPSRATSPMGSLPNPAAAWSETWTRASPATRLDPAQQDRCRGVPRERERLAALDDPRAGDPAPPPDQRALLVPAAPDVPRVARRDGVGPGSADERGEDRVVMPSGGAHPRDVAARPHEGASLTVGQERVVTQDVRWELDRRVHASSPSSQPLLQHNYCTASQGRRRRGGTRHGRLGGVRGEDESSQ